MQGITANRKSKKAGGINEQLGLHNSFFQKILTRANFLLAPATNILGASRFPIGCMKWQHADFLESICETNSIIISLPAHRTGFLTPFLTCFTLLSSLLGQNIFSRTPFPFSSFEENYSKSNSSSFLCSFWTKNTKSNSNSTKIFYDNSILCLSYRFIPILQKNSKSNILSDS